VWQCTIQTRGDPHGIIKKRTRLFPVATFRTAPGRRPTTVQRTNHVFCGLEMNREDPPLRNIGCQFDQKKKAVKTSPLLPLTKTRNSDHWFRSLLPVLTPLRTIHTFPSQNISVRFDSSPIQYHPVYSDGGYYTV
jgi:hypothetical protein